MVMSAEETECVVQELVPFAVDEVGGADFLTCAYQLERLSLQAHSIARDGSSICHVTDAIHKYQKITDLVKILLAVEAWRTNVLWIPSNQPVLAHLSAKNGNTLRCSFILHVESTIVGLLNFVLYRTTEPLDCDTAIALIGYCARCMISLVEPLDQNKMLRLQKEANFPSVSALDRIQSASYKEEYQTAVMAATSLARHFCENIDSLPLGAQTRILDTHDFLILFVALLVEPPWTRKRTGANGETTWEKLIENDWQRAIPSDLLRLTECEGQCWISVVHLTCNEACRERHGLNSHRKEELLRLSKIIHPSIIDQLEVLLDVKRYLENLERLDVSSVSDDSNVLMEQVPVIRESLLRGYDWGRVAQTQFETIFSKVTDATDADLHRLANVYTGVEGDLALSNKRKPLISTMVSLPKNITLSIEIKKGVLEEVFHLTMLDGPVEVQTPHVTFRRTQVGVTCCDGYETSLAFPKKCRVVATIELLGDYPIAKSLTLGDIDLPVMEDPSKKLPSREWRQLGSLHEENVILQLGFKRTPLAIAEVSKESTYILDRAFISLPA